MDMQYKEGINGEVGIRPVGKGKVKRSDLFVRFLALVLTLAAAVVLGANNQSTTVSVKIVPSLPPVNLPVTAKWLYMSAFVYLVIANAIACFYATMSLVLTLAARGGKKNVTLIVTILDIVMVALLFSAMGAAGAVGLIGLKGNSHLQWGKVCNVFDKFCHQTAAAMILSFNGSICYLLLVVLATINVYKKF
ncbi:CASP-like protein 1E2 [Lactuca sativa]|nr:CASP-like protein 1E2 [Lactuca sativa]